MSLQVTKIDEVRTELHLLIDQLPPEQLQTVYNFLHQSLFANGYRNGSVKNGAPTTSEALAEEQPWRQYTTHLKASPHWDEFLGAVATARQETKPNEDPA